MPQATRSLVLGIFFLLSAIFLFDLQGVIIKVLGDRYPVEQLAVLRNVFGIIPSLLVLLLSREWNERGRIIRIRHWRLGIARGFMIAGAQFCFYLSITKMALATASTLTYISPVLITLLSVVLLHHRIGRWRWVAVFTGFAGVILVMRPGSDLFTPYSLLPLGAALGYSLSTVCIRLMDDEAPTALLNMYSAAGSLAGSLCLVLATGGYVAVGSLSDWLLLLAMGLVGGFAVLFLLSAYRRTDPSNLSPFEYFGIPFAFGLGWVFFGEAPFEQLFPGVLLIAGGGLLIAWRERQKQLQPTPAQRNVGSYKFRPKADSD